MVKVTVKWKKEIYEEVDVNLTAPVIDFKNKLYTLTGVPVERQKLMSKSWKGTLKDGTDLSTTKLADGSTVVLMGSSTGIPKPEKETIFIEDMSVADAAKAGAVLPAGFVNLGNTCYMNSTLQCLRAVPELREALRDGRQDSGSGSGAGAGGVGMDMASTLESTFSTIDGSVDPVPPVQFWNTLRMRYPQFAEMGPSGPRQQDSEEFQSALLTDLAESLRKPTSSLPSLVRGNAIDTLFGVDLEVTLTCSESEAEAPVKMDENQRKLVCNIEGGAGRAVQVNHLLEGIRLGLEGDLEKNSSVLGRNAVWKKTGRISRFPKYLAVQLMRFYWKATPESMDHTGVKCKMLRPVSFEPDNLDLYEFCTPAVQAKLEAARSKYLLDDEAKESAKEETKESASASAAAPSASADAEEDDDLAAALRMSMGEDVSAAASASAGAGAGGSSEGSASVGIDLPENFCGAYELFAVVTHKGRSADAGHYMGWVRQRGDDWLCFDDDEVSPCKTEDVTRLKGGGDYHMASMLFYRAKSGLGKK